MPLGSSKLGVFVDKAFGSANAYPSPVSNITPNSFSITGNNAVLLNIFTEDSAYYNTNLQVSAVGTNADVFTDSSNVNTVAINGSGVATLLKRINGNVTSSANLQFRLETTTGSPLFTTNNVSITGFPWIVTSTDGTVTKSNGMVYYYLTSANNYFTVDSVTNTSNIHVLAVGGGGHGGAADAGSFEFMIQQNNFAQLPGNSAVILNNAALSGGGGGGEMYELKDIQLTSANVGGTTTVTQIGPGGTDTTANQTGGNTIVSSNLHQTITVIGGGGGASAAYQVNSTSYARGFNSSGRTTGNLVTSGTVLNGRFAQDTVLAGTGGGGATFGMEYTSFGNYLGGESIFKSLSNDYMSNNPGFMVIPQSEEQANGSFRKAVIGSGAGSGGGGAHCTVITAYNDTTKTVPLELGVSGYAINYFDYYRNVFDAPFPDPSTENYVTPWEPYIGEGGTGGGGIGETTPADETNGYGAGGQASYPGKPGAVIIRHQDYTYTGDWTVNK